MGLSVFTAIERLPHLGDGRCRVVETAGWVLVLVAGTGGVAPAPDSEIVAVVNEAGPEGLELLGAESVVVVHGGRREVWALGPAQWRVDGECAGPAALDAVHDAALAALASSGVTADRSYAALADFRSIQRQLRERPWVGPLAPGSRVEVTVAGTSVIRVGLPPTSPRQPAPASAAEVAPRTGGEHPLRVAAQRYDFVEVLRLLPAADLDEGTRRTVSRLARAGHLLLDLDLEDLASPPKVDASLRARLREVCLPQSAGSADRGLLGSLLPTVSLLLEVLAVRHAQRDIDALLATVHLVGEVLPLLAWEPVLGHAGDPPQLRGLVTRQSSRWAATECPAGGVAQKAARAAVRAHVNAQAWQTYVERSWSRLGVQLAECARCDERCAVATFAAPRRDGLRRRLALADLVTRGPLLGLRHGSTVGHAFAIPDLAEIDEAWHRTRERAAAAIGPIATDDGHPLPGLRAVLVGVAGQDIPDRQLLADVRAALIAALEPYPSGERPE